jgi:hypothetical protein
MHLPCICVFTSEIQTRAPLGSQSRWDEQDMQSAPQ